MIANYHTHTKYCHHAQGEAEEYVRGAIAMGLEINGFSDHAPFAYPDDGFEAHFRVSTADAATEIAELRALREKYKGQIELPIGFEMEYYPDWFDAMLSYVKSVGAEYLILGQHFFECDKPGYPRTLAPTFSDELLRKYADNLIAGLETGVFSYLAHPDVVWYMGPKKTYIAEMGRICDAANRLDIPLELNLLGIWKNRNYPKKAFWKLVGEKGCKVVLGIDAHGPERFAMPEIEERAMEWVRKYGLNLVEKVELRKL